MNILTFDIETIPDIEAGRAQFNAPELPDDQIVKAMQAMQRQKNGSDFLPHRLQRVVAISVVHKHNDSLKVTSLGDVNSDETDIIKRFFAGIERYTPTLVSWNGGGFDLPVLHYRALLHHISAPLYWEQGEHNNNFRWNNYLNRYHERHTDLMDVLSGFQMRAAARLDDVASMLGFPGKMGMSGASVWKEYQEGNIEGIRNYCETDVMNTYLVYLRYQLMRGNLTDAMYEELCEELYSFCKAQSQPHFTQFLDHTKSHTF